MLLLTVVYVQQPVEFSVFPSLLLLLTLVRLSLNVASTRLVLLHGAEGVEAAGNVIMSFGQFVVGGNFVVGIVVFLVLIAIQFLVINHGAVRISEVTARFTLDAMPGRQMAIDADLNAGLIDEREARTRRERVRREADFYGAMDGAIRFTQRDALAAVLITGVNIVAGLIIGVVQHGLDLATAAQTYTILTVGEGLVTAIPALLVSMSGGLITTRAASESNLGEEVAVQLLARARPLAVAAGVLVALALIPGLPKFPFLAVARCSARRPTRTARRSRPAEDADAAAAPRARRDRGRRSTVDPLSVEVGYALVSLVDEKQGGTLLNRVRAIRRQIATETGVVVPPVHVADNLQLPPRVYAILVKGVEVARGELYADRLLAINPGTADRRARGHRRRSEPAFGLPAVWIAAEQREKASAAGFTVVDPTTALSTHLSETIRDVPAGSAEPPADEGARGPRRADLAEARRGAGAEARVGRRRPARAAAAAARARAGPRPDDDSRSHRRRGGRDEGHRRDDRGRARGDGARDLPAVPERQGRSARDRLAPALEERLLRSIVRTEQGAVLALDPSQAQRLASRIARVFAQAVAQPVLLCSPALRPHLWRLFARVLPQSGRAVAQRDAIAGSDCGHCHTRLTCI